MFDASDLQLEYSVIDPPGNDEKFEIFCCALVRKVWNDPNAQRVGRSGQNQHGIDVISCPQGVGYCGLQSKKRDQHKGKLTETDIRKEVEKAKKFDQPLQTFYIVTTLSRDANLQAIARKVTEENKSEGLFSVYIWGWEDIIENLLEHKDLLYTYWPHLRPAAETFNTTQISEIKRNVEKILDQQPTKKETNISNYGQGTVNVSINDVSAENKKDVIHVKLDVAREKINNNNPVDALKDLEAIKKDYWAIADDAIKFRIITNFAAAESKIGKLDEAAKHFLEARQYNSEDEKALCNAATAYLLQENKKEAMKVVEKALKINPASDRAYSLKVYSTDEKTSIEDIIKEIPSINLNSSTVSYSLGYILKLRGDNSSAINWLRSAAKKDPGNIEINTTLAETLLQIVIDNQNFIYGQQLTQEVKSNLEEVDVIYKAEWKNISDKEVKKFRASWLANRALANRLLKKHDVALTLINEALELKPDEEAMINQKALLLFEVGKKEEAISLIKTIKDYETKPDIAIPLTAVLRSIDRTDEAIEILTKLKGKLKDRDAIRESNRMLIDLFISTNQIGKAKEISEELISKDPNNISNYIDMAHISIVSKDKNYAESLLKTAKEKIGEETTNRQLIELGNAFYATEKFNDAIDIFEKFVDTKSDSDPTRKLLNSYYRTGRFGEALKITETLKSLNGEERYITELESSIFEEIGDWDKAKKTCCDYLEKNKDDQEIEIRYAIALLRSGSENDLKELDALLKKGVRTTNLSFNFWMQLVGLYERRGFVDIALKNAYEVRRKFFDNPDAHMQYIGLFFRTEKSNDLLFKDNKISTDSTAHINSGMLDQWYILDEREDADLSKKEINKKHPLFQKLVGKKVGDEVEINDSGPTKQTAKIKEIKSKYVYALHESLNNFNSLFPEAEGLWGIQVDTSEQKDGKEIPKGIQTMLDQISKRDSFIHKVEQFYKDGKLTVGAFAQMIGKDILTMWGGLISSRGPGLKSANGTIDERRESLIEIRKKPKLIIDPISIMTIHGIGLADEIVGYFGKPGVAFSTIELMRTSILEKVGIEAQGYMNVSKEGDKFIKEEITEEQIQKNKEYLESIVKWIGEKCDILPLSVDIPIEIEKKNQNEKLLGKESSDTILIAKESGRILYSDDERLRSFAKNSYDTPGVYTQLLMMEMLDKGVIAREKYAQCIIKLINSNYYHTGVSKDVILEAAKQSSWRITEPLTTMVNKLKGKGADLNSAVAVGSEVLREMWGKEEIKISEDEKTEITKYLIDALIEDRSMPETLQRLKLEIDRLFIYDSVNKEKIKSSIRSWSKEKRFNFDV
jgi:tetratricopeptide (TPR) repeat protein